MMDASRFFLTQARISEHVRVEQMFLTISILIHYSLRSNGIQWSILQDTQVGNFGASNALQDYPVAWAVLRTYHNHLEYEYPVVINPLYSAVVTLDASLSLETSHEQGAILTTKNNTFVYNVLRPDVFKEYMLRNYKSWIKFGRNNWHSVDYDNLVFVTGVDLTESYEMLAYAKSHQQLKSNFVLDVPQIGNASLGAWRMENRPYNLWQQAGPDAHQLAAHGQANFSTMRVVAVSSVAAEDDGRSEARQCTFLRGWRLRTRLGPVERITANAEPEDLGSPPDPRGSNFTSHQSPNTEGFDDIEVVGVGNAPQVSG
jgi:hypothetical protein